MSVKVLKFGGSSVADADQIRKIKAIVEADPERRYVVVSAPGKRFKADNKVTDLLYTGEGDQRVLTLTFTAMPENYSEWKRKLLQPV